MNKSVKILRLRAALAVTAAVTVAAVLCGYIANTTLSKYRRSVSGYTDIRPADFHAALLGAETVQSLTDKWATGSSAALFGEDISLEVLQPGGDPETIPFALANATDSDKVSGVDIIYTLSLRTTGNLPLVFTLLRKVDSSAVTDKTTINSDGYEVYKTGSSCLVENGDTGDAPTYLYSLYLVHNAGLENEYLESKTREFTLEGGKLSMDEYELIIEWPAECNDSSYMKEVDVIQLVADLVSADRRETDEYYQISVITDYRGTGLFVLYPSATYYKTGTSQYGTGNTEYTYRYKFTHDAFGSSESALYGTTIGEISSTSVEDVASQLPASIAQSTTSSAYKIRVTNGSGILDANGDPVSDITTKYVDLRMRVYFPLTKETIDSTGTLITYFDVLAQFPDGSVHQSTLSKYDSKQIASYDITTGVFTELGTNKFEEIGALVNSSGYDAYTSKIRYYYIYDFGMKNENGQAITYDEYYDYQLQNYNEDGTRKLDYINFILLTDMSPQEMYDLPVYNEFFIEATALYRE